MSQVPQTEITKVTTEQVNPNEQIDPGEAAYLAGYLERSGSLSIYTQKAVNQFATATTKIIISAGIRIRLRDPDSAALTLCASRFGGKVHRRGQFHFWTAVNTRAAQLLKGVYPFLRRGTRRILVNQLLEFHVFMSRKRKSAKLLRQPLNLSEDDRNEILFYQETIRALK